MVIQSVHTIEEIDKSISYRLTPPTYDIVDGVYITGNTLPVNQGQQYRLVFDSQNLAREFSNGFSSKTGITKMYDFDNNVSYFQEFNDTPTIVALPNCYFKPSASSEGECIIRCFVNEPSPILLDQAIVGFKGQVYEKMGDLFSFYLGDEIGFQLKTKGIYFTFEFTLAGELKDMGLYQYLT